MEEGLSRGQSTSELREIVPDELEGLLIQPKIDAGLIDETDGIEGAALYPVGIGPFGITCDDNYHQEAMNAAYSAYPMMEYYDYTQDKSYLEGGLYDLLKACGAYYEAWLTKEDTEDGDYEYALYAAYNEGSFSKNPAVELAKNLFSHLIEYSEILGRDEAKRDQWNEILAHLPEQPTAMASGGESLALAELETPKENGQWVADVSQWKPMASPIPGDGNAIPLDAVLPGNVYNHYSSPEDLELVTNTIQTFVDNGNPWGQINNFPRIFPEAVEAGYDINTIVNAFVGQLNGKLQKNLTIEDNNHGFEKAGSIETVNQMMLNSECGMIDIFPNWLSDKDAEYAGFAAKGGFTVSAGYDGTEQAVSHVEITSTLGNECKLVSPWGGSVTVTDESGSEVETTEGKIPYYEQYDADGETEYSDEGVLITFDTEEDKTYTITRVYSDDEIIEAKEELGAMIAEAEEALENKTPDSDPYDEEANKALSDAIDAAKAVYETEDASFSEMKAQTAALQAALDAFDIAYGQWERPLGDPVMSGETPHMGTVDGYDVIAWEKGTGRMEYPSGSIADVLEIPSGTVVSNLTIDVSYYYDQAAGNSWWHFNTYDENGESAPGVSNGKPHDDGFGDFPGDYKMVSGEWAEVSVSRDNQMLGSGKADWFINVGGAGEDNSNSLYIRGYRVTATLEDGTVKTGTWGTMGDEAAEPEEPVNLDTLKELLADAKEHVANGDVDKCIEAVQKLFDKAIAEAEAVIAKGSAATAEEVDNAEDLVSLAIHSLSFTAPDKAALKEAIDLGGRYDLGKYVEEGKAEFTEALETAKEVYENGNALQEEVTRERRCIQDSAGGSAGCDGR